MPGRGQWLRVVRPGRLKSSSARLRSTASFCRSSTRLRTGWHGQAPSVASAGALARIWPTSIPATSPRRLPGELQDTSGPVAEGRSIHRSLRVGAGQSGPRSLTRTARRPDDRERRTPGDTLRGRDPGGSGPRSAAAPAPPGSGRWWTGRRPVPLPGRQWPAPRRSGGRGPRAARPAAGAAPGSPARRSRASGPAHPRQEPARLHRGPAASPPRQDKPRRAPADGRASAAHPQDSRGSVANTGCRAGPAEG